PGVLAGPAAPERVSPNDRDAGEPRRAGDRNLPTPTRAGAGTGRNPSVRIRRKRAPERFDCRRAGLDSREKLGMLPPQRIQQSLREVLDARGLHLRRSLEERLDDPDLRGSPSLGKGAAGSPPAARHRVRPESRPDDPQGGGPEDRAQSTGRRRPESTKRTRFRIRRLPTEGVPPSRVTTRRWT